VWIAAAHAVCAGVFLMLAKRAPVIEDEADLPFLEPHQVDRSPGEPRLNIPATLQRDRVTPRPCRSGASAGFQEGKRTRQPQAG
jgi:hypothetical protein